MSHLPRKISLGLAFLVGLMIILGIAAVMIDFGPARMLFHLDVEASVANWFSTVLLFLVATCSAYIASVKTIREERYAMQWRYLSLIFLLLSIEEVAAIRDKVITPYLRQLLDLEGALQFAWVIPGIMFVILFSAFYARFIWRLPHKTRLFFITGIVIYVGGAVGFEIMGAAVLSNAGEYSIAYNMMITGEEGLEFVGILFLLHALMTYIWYETEALTSSELSDSENHERLLSLYAKSILITVSTVSIIVVILYLIIQYSPY